MYKTNFISHNIAEYYNNEKLLFLSKRRRLFLGIGSITSIFHKDELIFSFYDFDCTILYQKLKILFQNLSEKVFLEKVKLNYVLVVNNKKISLKFSNNPFKKKIGKIYIDKLCVCEIEKFKTFFNFNFLENAELEYYCIILFSMYSVGITKSP